MLQKVVRCLAIVLFVVGISVGFSALVGCEKTERHVHTEKVEKNKVIDEGPVVD